MTCQVDPVTTDNALVYSSLNNATLAAGESEASAAMAASSVLAAATLATAATAAKDAAFSSETLASESAATAVTKAYVVHNKAIESTIQRELAHKWATENESVWVSDGVNVPGYSAYHWAKQAQQQNGLTMGGIAQYIADGVADYITYNAIGNSLLNTALGTRIEQIDVIDARTRADALITLQEIVDRGTAITNERTLRLAGEDRLAQDITTLSATMVANIAAAVLTESSARADEFDASAMVMSLLTAQLNDPVTGLVKTRADILTESTVRADEFAATATRIDTLTSTFTTDISNVSAAIQTEATTRASQDSALASSVSTLQTTVGGNTTAIETAQTSVDGINAKYTVKIDTNGYVSGYGLMSTAVDGVPVSSFAIRADTFSIGAPAVPASAGQAAVAASKVYPLVVKTTKETIDGTVFQPGVYINSAFITKITASQINTKGLTIKDANGTEIFSSGTKLTGTYIADATIDSAQIANLAVTTGKIANLSVTTGKIGNLAVDTLQIAGNAVTTPLAFNSPGQIGVPQGWGELGRLVIPADNYAVNYFITFGFSFINRPFSSFGSNVYSRIDIVLNTNPAYTFYQEQWSLSGYVTGGCGSAGFLYNLPAGSTVTIIMYGYVYNSNTSTCTQRFITAMGVKR
jgi:hypothetical protein